MRIIAIETSGRSGSVAALCGETGADARLLQHVVLGSEAPTAQSLAPALRLLLETVDWQPDSIQLVAVAVGPGSFTGLRIGVTTAKTLAYAVGAEIIGANTLAVLASQAPRAEGPLWIVMDAQRQELFVAKFAGGEDSPAKRILDTVILPQDSWLAQLQPGDRVTGPALQRLAARLPAGVIALPEDLWQPTAGAAGRVAWHLYQAGHRDDVWKLVPNYYRPSAAEEKLSRNT